MEKTDDELAKEMQELVNKLNAVIFKAEIRDLLVEIRQANGYSVSFGNKPTSFLVLKVSKSLLDPPIPCYTGGY